MITESFHHLSSGIQNFYKFYAQSNKSMVNAPEDRKFGPLRRVDCATSEKNTVAPESLDDQKDLELLPDLEFVLSFFMEKEPNSLGKTD